MLNLNYGWAVLTVPNSQGIGTIEVSVLFDTAVPQKLPHYFHYMTKQYC